MGACSRGQPGGGCCSKFVLGEVFGVLLGIGGEEKDGACGVRDLAVRCEVPPGCSAGRGGQGGCMENEAFPV